MNLDHIAITQSHSSTRLTMAEAVKQSSLGTEEILANLLIHLVNKNLISTSDLEEIFYWDFSIEDLRRLSDE